MKKYSKKAVEAFKVWASKGITAERNVSECVLRAKKSQKCVKIVSEKNFEKLSFEGFWRVLKDFEGFWRIFEGFLFGESRVDF